jgi:hypothetical protein
MDHEVVPRPSKRRDWTLKSSQDDLGLHQGKNGRVTTEVEVHKFVFLSLLTGSSLHVNLNITCGQSLLPLYYMS